MTNTMITAIENGYKNSAGELTPKKNPAEAVDDKKVFMPAEKLKDEMLTCSYSHWFACN